MNKLTLFLFVTFLFAVGNDIVLSSDKPEKVYRLCYVQKSKQWYQKQAELWKKEIDKNLQNEYAWYNYFFAERYGWSGNDNQTKTREELLDSIYNEMGKSIPYSWIYHYIHYYNYGNNISRLEKAYKINPNEPDLYWEFIKEYELTDQKEKKKEFCEKLYQSKDISSGILNMNFNTLISTEPNSILFTNGDNDTYPAYVLQDAKGIREDVLILNVHAVFGLRKYLKRIIEKKGIQIDIDRLSKSDIPSFLDDLIHQINNKYPEIPIYSALTVYRDYFKNFQKDLYLTGFAYKYSKESFDNESIHKDILENKLRLDYLNNDFYDDLHVSKPLVDRFNLNYIDPFLKLVKYFYSRSETESAQQWKNMALMIAERINNYKLIERIQSMK